MKKAMQSFKTKKMLTLGALLGLVVILGMSACQREDSSSTNSRALTHDEVAGEPALKADADDLKQTIVTPHVEQPIIRGKNILWCSTFQLAWNELCDLSGGPIQMAAAPPMVAVLNKKAATKDDLDKSDYVARAGIVREGIVETIKKELADKFHGQASPRLLALAQNLPPDCFVAYSYLFKAMPFKHAFAEFDRPLVFNGSEVASFGMDWQIIDDDRVREKLAEQVIVLAYETVDDFVIELKTTSKGDRLILAKVAPAKTLEETVRAVRKRLENARGIAMQYAGTLQVPVLNFDVLREYSGLCKKPLSTRNPEFSGREIEVALQLIRFRLDRTGAVLESEAYMEECMSEQAFVFDKPFLILLQREGAKNPYFALWVDNAELLVPFEKSSALHNGMHDADQGWLKRD